MLTQENLPITNNDIATVSSGASVENHSAPKNFDDVFKLWSKYEDTAMHFNDLLIKLRVQVLGGVTLSGTLAATILKEQNNDSLRYVFSLFLLGWIAVWILDMGYYNRLLSGAVDGIIELEDKFPEFQLSTKIKKSVNESWSKAYGVMLFYSIIFIGLIIISTFLFYPLIGIEIWGLLESRIQHIGLS
jgi:hypothetical protein